jgi:hypothetical protein
MQEEKRYIEQNGVVQQGGQEAVDTEEDKILLDTVLDGGAVQGKEGGLRMDMFSHDDPDDLPCLCDLPYAAQEIIHDEIEHSKSK